jgi:hypothetical protein
MHSSLLLALPCYIVLILHLLHCVTGIDTDIVLYFSCIASYTCISFSLVVIFAFLLLLDDSKATLVRRRADCA